MTVKRMDQYQKIHYVYQHVHPETRETVYVGHGCKSRAWIMGTSLKAVGKYGHRKVDHQEWLEARTAEGYVATDWVVILAQGLSKKEACSLEQEYIRKITPVYNDLLGLKLLKLSADVVVIAHRLRDTGLSYKNIAEELQSSTMTVWRALNGKNKNSNG